MSFNGNVLASLNSYMVNASRPYRLHPLLKNNEIKSTLGNIHKLTFKVWVRVLLSKESEVGILNSCSIFNFILFFNYSMSNIHRKTTCQVVFIPGWCAKLLTFRNY